MKAKRNARRGHTNIADAAWVMHRRARAGYHDSLAVRPYPAEYDLWETNQQLAYETGRLWASSLAGTALLVAAPWPEDGPPPAALRAAVNQVAAALGSPFPERKMPPDDAPLALEPETQPRRKKWRRRRASTG